MILGLLAVCSECVKLKSAQTLIYFLDPTSSRDSGGVRRVLCGRHGSQEAIVISTGSNPNASSSQGVGDSKAG